MEEKKSQRREGYVLDKEKDLLQSYFKDNEELLLALRNLLLGFELDENEKAILSQVLRSDEAIKLLNKIFFPQLGKKVPIGQSVDLWMTVKLEDPSRDKVNIKARQLLIKKIETALKRLENLEIEIDLTPVLTVEELMNRNTFITHIEQQLTMIRTMANMDKETEEERIVRQAKDSLK